MSRGMPWSVLLHVLLISLAVLYGNTVQRRVLEPPLLMRAHLVPSSVLADAAVTPAQEQPAPEASPPPQEAPELPPKEVPVERPKPKETPKTEAKPKPPQPKPEQKPAESLQKPADAGETGPVQPSLSGPSVQGTDTNFPFAWYLSTVESQVARNWRPRQLGFGERSRVSCAVHFVIGRNGAITQVTLKQGSGVGVYDREALRAVQATRLPALPPQYGGSTLGVTFIFNLEPGM